MSLNAVRILQTRTEWTTATAAHRPAIRTAPDRYDSCPCRARRARHTPIPQVDVSAARPGRTPSANPPVFASRIGSTYRMGPSANDSAPYRMSVWSRCTSSQTPPTEPGPSNPMQQALQATTWSSRKLEHVSIQPSSGRRPYPECNRRCSERTGDPGNVHASPDRRVALCVPCSNCSALETRCVTQW